MKISTGMTLPNPKGWSNDPGCISHKKEGRLKNLGEWKRKFSQEIKQNWKLIKVLRLEFPKDYLIS